MRLVRNAIFLVIGLVIGGLSTLAKADTYPAYDSWSIQTITPRFPTAEAACQSKTNYGVGSVYYDTVIVNASLASCRGKNTTTNAIANVYDANRSLYCATGNLSGTNCINAPSCAAGTVRATDGTCQSPCVAKAGTSYGQSVFQYNATAAAAYNAGDASQANNVIGMQCDNGCQIKIDATSAWTETSAVVAGTSTSFVQGNAKYTGSACTADQSAPMSTTPSNTCASGQTAGTINGKFACVTAAGTPVNTQKPVTQTQNPPVTQSDGSTKQTTITSNSDGSITTTITTTASDGTKTIQASTTPGIGGGTGTSTGSGTGNIDTSTLAKESTLAAIKDALTVSGSTTGKGLPNQPDSYYETDYPDGVQGVWNDFKSQLNTTPFISLLNQMNPNFSGGTCPTWSMDFSPLGFGVIQFSDLCYIFIIIKSIMILTALFTARAIIFGG